MKKVSDEDLKRLVEFRQDYSRVIFELGELVAKMSELDKQLSQMESDKFNYLSTYEVLIQKDRDLFKEMSDKYGVGAINMETGEIS